MEIAILYESYRTVMCLIGKIQYSYVPNWVNAKHFDKYRTLCGWRII